MTIDAVPTSALSTNGARPALDWHEHRGRNAEMTVKTTFLDATSAHVRVVGELDLGTAAALWAVLRGHLNAGRRFLRLDVHGLRFLDATALSGILAIHREALDARGTLILTGVRPVVSRILSVTGLSEKLFISGPRADEDVAYDEIQRLLTAS